MSGKFFYILHNSQTVNKMIYLLSVGWHTKYKNNRIKRRNAMFTIKGRKKQVIKKTVSFDEELYNKLKEVACKADISVNALILQCCEYAKDNLSDEDNKCESPTEISRNSV
jgi:hypothetical protein